MSLVTLLRVLVVAVILLPVLGVTIDTMAPGLLPPELAAARRASSKVR